MLCHLISLVRRSTPHHWLWQGVIGSLFFAGTTGKQLHNKWRQPPAAGALFVLGCCPAPSSLPATHVQLLCALVGR